MNAYLKLFTHTHTCLGWVHGELWVWFGCGVVFVGFVHKIFCPMTLIVLIFPY